MLKDEVHEPWTQQILSSLMSKLNFSDLLIETREAQQAISNIII